MALRYFGKLEQFCEPFAPTSYDSAELVSSIPEEMHVRHFRRRFERVKDKVWQNSLRVFPSLRYRGKAELEHHDNDDSARDR